MGKAKQPRPKPVTDAMGQDTVNDCRFMEVTCNHYRKKGHIAKACHSRDRPPGAKPVRRVSEGDTEENPIEPLMAVRSTGKYTPHWR